MEHVPATLSSKYVAKDHPRSAVYQRAVTRRLVNDFNTDGDTRGISLRADENQLTDFPHFEKYLRRKSIASHICLRQSACVLLYLFSFSSLSRITIHYTHKALFTKDGNTNTTQKNNKYIHIT